MGVGSFCATGADVSSGVWFSVLAGLGWCLMLARPSTGKGGGKGIFPRGEGVPFCGEGEFSTAGGIEISDGGEGEASWVAGPSVFGATT